MQWQRVRRQVKAGMLLPRGRLCTRIRRSIRRLILKAEHRGVDFLLHAQHILSTFRTQRMSSMTLEFSTDSGKLQVVVVGDNGQLQSPSLGCLRA